MAKILIVDDDQAVATVMAEMLADAGHDATIAAHKDDRTLALAQEGPFEGAIIDVWLGPEDGLNVAKDIASRSPPIPFVIVSGGGPNRSLETVTARADALGAAAMLFKPFDNDELLRAVEEMLASTQNRR